MQFDITVVDYRRSGVPGRFDILLGFGPAFENAARASPDAIRIYLATGAPSDVQLEATYQAGLRLKDLSPSYRGNDIVALLRVPEGHWPIQSLFSDLIIAVGNGPNKAPFSKLAKVAQINPIVIPSAFGSPMTLEAAQAKRFLWYGGRGSLHKGLDLCIEAFRKIDHELGVAGFPDSRRLMEIMGAPANIRHVGQIDRNNRQHQAALAQYAFIILPSCCEGNATAVVSMVVDRGMIPVVTDACGILPSPHTITIDRLDVASVMRAIELALNTAPDKIRENSATIQKSFRTAYSVDSYAQQFRAIMADAIKC